MGAKHRVAATEGAPGDAATPVPGRHVETPDGHDVGTGEAVRQRDGPDPLTGGEQPERAQVPGAFVRALDPLVGTRGPRRPGPTEIVGQHRRVHHLEGGSRRRTRGHSPSSAACRACPRRAARARRRRRAPGDHRPGVAPLPRGIALGSESRVQHPTDPGPAPDHDIRSREVHQSDGSAPGAVVCSPPAIPAPATPGCCSSRDAPGRRRRPRGGSAWSRDRQTNERRRCRHSAIVGHEGCQLAAEQLRRRQMNGVETAQDARVERRRCIEKLFVDLHEVQPLQESSGPGQRPRTVPTDRAKDLDPGQGTGGPSRLLAKIAAERRGLGLGDDQLHQRGGVQVHHPRLSLPGPPAKEHGARAGPAGHGRQRWAEIEQISRRRDHAPAADQALDMAGAAQGDKQGDGPPARGDFQSLPRLDMAEILACPLSQLPDTDGFHGATL